MKRRGHGAQGMVRRDQGRGVPGPVQHSKGWGPDVGARRTPYVVSNPGALWMYIF